MKQSVLCLSIFLLFACQAEKENTCKQDFLVIPIGGKLEALLSLPQDTVLEYYDLSNDFLFDFPDLSGYTVRSLNLSHNYLMSFGVSFFPKELEILDLSHNCLMQSLYVDQDSVEKLRNLNLSHNCLPMYEGAAISHLDLSHNDLNYVRIVDTYGHYLAYFGEDYVKKNAKRMNYLNISYNPRLSNRVWFCPEYIDTVIYNNIANDKKLEMLSIIPSPDICDVVFASDTIAK